MNCIYAFFNKETQECLYVGSTRCFWKRFGKHLCDSYSNKQQYKLYAVIREKGGWDNIEYRILEQNLKLEDLLLREKHHYLSLKPIGNRQSPLQTEEERQEQIKNKNRNRNLPQVKCDCGSIIPSHNVVRHLLTIKHQTWASSQSA